VLSELIVRNFAVIRDLEVSFSDGLTIITGETGAGKSILVGAVNLILGARASQEMIRTGTEEAMVEAMFELAGGPSLEARLAAAELPHDGSLVIRRGISRSGRNRIFANGRLITLQQLNEIMIGMISVSGQHEHQLLLDPTVHLSVLDRFAGTEPLLRETETRYRAWQTARNELQQLHKLRRERSQQLEFMQYQLKELEAARLQPDEDLLLEQERKLLKHAATLHDAADGAHRLLYSDSHAILGSLNQVAAHVEALCGIDSRQAALRENLEQGKIHLEELAYALQQYASEISFDPYRLTEIEERLALIQRMSKKYGATVAEMIERTEALREALSDSDDPEIRELELTRKLASCRVHYLEQAQQLSRSRRNEALRLTREMEQVLSGLDLPKARFGARFVPEDESAEVSESAFSESGIDQLEFLLSANPGEDLKPLARIASGGELSRILLALKSLLSVQGQAETLIFDEVDAGIGGRTAELVGRQLQRLARHHQVLCITHLPQIACYGQQHLRVAKAVEGDTTHTGISPLSPAQRVEELARMLGGVVISEKTRAHAREWLEKAGAIK
jgi:DNA repair protein RecN (Recombination protein N)